MTENLDQHEVEDKNWGFEPTLVTFFIPLLDRVGFIHGSTFTLERHESVPWARGVPVMVKEHLPAIPNEDGMMWVSLKVWRPRAKLEPPTEPIEDVNKVFYVVSGEWLFDPEAELKPSNIGGESAGTVITAVAPLLRAEGQGLVEAVGITFDKCLEEINVLIRAYVTQMGASEVRLLSRRNVYPSFSICCENQQQTGRSEHMRCCLFTVQ